jgi:hypothetical protein
MPSGGVLGAPPPEVRVRFLARLEAEHNRAVENPLAIRCAAGVGRDPELEVTAHITLEPAAL